MASVLYKDKLIVSRAVLDEATRTWKPNIQLTLDRGQSFHTKAEAERAGIDGAKELIDAFDYEKIS